MPGDILFSPKTQAYASYAPLISTQQLWPSAVKFRRKSGYNNFIVSLTGQKQLFISLVGKNESVLTNIDKCVVTHKL